MLTVNDSSMVSMSVKNGEDVPQQVSRMPFSQEGVVLFTIDVAIL